MLKILKASAGSGKTYNLAREYIRLILMGEKPDAYRHVLAVTFTNKATDEMKRRILKELYTLAREPETSSYFKDFVPALFGDAERLRQKARQQLTGILHDYSAFAVSTIDRFFQQTLRAFSREIGQFSSYQVQLDRAALVNESVDRVLDTLSEKDGNLLGWLTGSVKEDLRQSGTFSLDKRLQEVAASLQTLPAGQVRFPRENLERLQKVCREIIKNYEEQVRAAAGACLAVFEAEGIDPAESNHGLFKPLYRYRDGKSPVSRPTDAFLRKAPDPAQWFAKSKDSLRQRLEGVLDAPVQAFLALFGTPYKEYNTAKTILGQIYGLGVAEELREAFTQIQKEKNVISIDDSNTILHSIIDGTDTPFIYEKLGVRYEDFLLDEFQDTADIQWENFRPLLTGSESTGNDSLVVGDVKQSIYRWRGSDWNLLGSRLEQEFRQVQRSVLDGNYRTCREIVTFNNAFFAFAAQELDRQGGEDPAAAGSISDLYRDVEQKVCFPDPEPGSVEVLFTEDQMQAVLETLRDIRERGGKWEDVAILVRSNRDGSAIASALVAENIPVVSDDSLFIKSSVTVRRLVSQLSLSDVPPGEDAASSAASFLAASLHVKIPGHYHSLIDLAEGFLRDLRESDPETFDAEIPYIQSFMDYLQDWVSTGGNNLSAFLRSWKDAEPKIASPRTGDSVRVMTIHKSKGLEFPFVIVPFTEGVTLYKASPYWCKPAVEGTRLEKEAQGVFHVSLDSSAAESLFSADYFRERKMEAIDNINVLYVAFTRAKYGLKVIAAPPPRSGIKEYKNMSQLLYGFVKTDHYTGGQPYPFDRIPREEGKEKILFTTYESYPADSGNRLKFSPEAADYFGEDGSFGLQASRRIRGNVLHGILSRTETSSDLPAAVDAAVNAGELPASLREETLALLSGKIASVESLGWFAPGIRVLREVPILAPDGREYRPDRVVLHPDGHVTVVDYKFGEQRSNYKKQVQRYADLFRRMGYGKVEGYLWYLDDNFTIFVTG
ncbi:MAG: UvrD-helicase domain-containing protein [Bacteroidales bacterium]|nr:UvrD-helicase domain-containing protein [Bacteroidales bacterium]